MDEPSYAWIYVLSIVVIAFIIWIVRRIVVNNETINSPLPKATKYAVSTKNNFSTAEEKSIAEAYKSWLLTKNELLQLESDIDCYLKKHKAAQNIWRNKIAAKLQLKITELKKQKNIVEERFKTLSYAFVKTKEIFENNVVKTSFAEMGNLPHDEPFFYYFFKNSPQYIYKITHTRHLVFLPCYMAIVDTHLGDIDIYTYRNVVGKYSAYEELTHYTNSDDELKSVHWLHERVSGGPDKRYSYNPSTIYVWRGKALLSLNQSNGKHVTCEINFSNRIKARKFLDSIKALGNYFRQGYGKILHDSWIMSPTASSTDIKNISDDFYAKMISLCTATDNWIIRDWLPELPEYNMVSIEYIGSKKSIIIPDTIQKNGKLYKVKSFEIPSDKQCIIENAIVLSESLYVSDRFFQNLKNLYISADVKTFDLYCGNNIRPTHLEHINRLDDFPKLKAYLLHGDIIDIPYIKSKLTNRNGLLFYEGNVVGADFNTEVYDDCNADTINLSWLTAEHALNKVIVSSKVTKIILPPHKNNNLSCFEIVNNSKYSFENGVLYGCLVSSKKILYFSKIHKDNVLLIDNAISGIGDCLPSYINTLILDNDFSCVTDGISVRNVRTIVITNESVQLKISWFKELGYYPLTIYTDFKVDEKIRKKKQVIIQPLATFDVFSAYSLTNDDATISPEEREKEVQNKTAKAIVVENGVIVKANGFIPEINIPIGTANQVGSRAFSKNIHLQIVKLPTDIEAIGDDAFLGDISLKRIELPRTLQKLGASSFSGCLKLSDVVIPSEVKIIEEKTFYGCKSLKNIIIPKSVHTIECSAFENCENLENVTFEEGSSLRFLRSSVFKNCKKLKQIALPTSARIISEGVFEGCSSLNNVSVAVEHIQKRAFAQCIALSTLSFGKQVVNIDKEAFTGCTSISQINGFENATWEQQKLFLNCPWIKTLAIDGVIASNGIVHMYIGENDSYVSSDGVIEIDEGAFVSNQSLVNVELTEGVRKISKLAFAFCPKLKSITIPESVTEIDENAFFGSPNVVIRCYRGSFASRFRIDNKIPGEYLTKAPTFTPTNRTKKSSSGMDGLSDEERRIIYNMRKEKERQLQDQQQQARVESTLQMVAQVYGSPILDCNSSHTITNNIFYRWYVSTDDSFPAAEYILYFIDDEGNVISNTAEIKPSQEKTKASFQLNSSKPFDANKVYYCMVANKTNNTIVGKIEYKINISFSDGFDF